jgi:hypothetical protein
MQAIISSGNPGRVYFSQGRHPAVYITFDSERIAAAYGRAGKGASRAAMFDKSLRLAE